MSRLVFLFAPLVAFALAACGGGEPSAPATTLGHDHLAAHARNPEPSPELNRQLAELRRATARFHDIDAARDAGYTVLFDPDGDGPGSACLSHPTEGAMGEHFVHPDLLFDGGALDIARPEALIYEPLRNGKYRLVAVEYVVPFSDAPYPGPAPMLLGEDFMPNDNPGFQLWALHVWVWQPNPSGLFAPWNPRVSCQYTRN
jgi:hypothetical protein